MHSQIFVDPNAKDNQPKTNAAAKPWLTISVPQLTADSGNDVCLMRDGTLCVVLVVKDASQATTEVLSLLNSIGQEFSSKISRGIQFNFNWLDASKEPEFAAVFGLEETQLP